jgi:hypothetical protein
MRAVAQQSKMAAMATGADDEVSKNAISSLEIDTELMSVLLILQRE